VNSVEKPTIMRVEVGGERSIIKLERFSVRLVKDITTAESECSGFAMLQEKLEAFIRSFVNIGQRERYF